MAGEQARVCHKNLALVESRPMSEKRHIDRVRIPLSRGTIALPWASRQALLDQFRRIPEMRPVLDAFEAAGTSQPVALTQEQKGELLGIIMSWASEDGYKGLPEGIVALVKALRDDAHDFGHVAEDR